MKNNLKNFWVVFIFLIFLIPFSFTDIENVYFPESDRKIEVISQEGNEFYEINPCKVSLFDFLIVNKKSIYQDHYYFISENKTPISCFGKVAGVSVITSGIETQFFISIGTNSLINLLLQSLFWIFIMTFIPKDKIFQKNIDKNYFLIFLTGIFFTFQIFSETRFYDQNIYEFDFLNLNFYLLPFCIFIFILIISIDIISSRITNLLSFLPWLYLYTLIFSGFNLNYFSIIIVYVGVFSITKNKKLNKFNFFYFLISIFWLVNIDTAEQYYFKVGKLRSFTSSFFSLYSNIYWIIFFLFLINGLFKIYKLSIDNFNFQKFTSNISLTSISLISIGLLAVNFPIINFLTYYYFGLQRYAVDENNPIAVDIYNQRISWRGLFPSSETIGEFFGLCLLFILFYIFKNKHIRNIDKLGIIFSGLGLYFSDNKTSIVLVFLIVLFYFYLFGFKNYSKKNKLAIKFSLSVFTIVTLFILIGFENITSSYSYISSTLYTRGLSYQIDSTSLLFIESASKNNILIKYFFGIISAVSLFVNRSIMWSLYFARYNPSLLEVIIGTGPLSFAKLYGEVLIENQAALLLPHSSILSYLTFFGILPLILIFLIFLKNILKNRKNYEFIILVTYILINIVKNDSLNYFVPFVFYFLILLIFRNKKSIFL